MAVPPAETFSTLVPVQKLGSGLGLGLGFMLGVGLRDRVGNSFDRNERGKKFRSQPAKFFPCLFGVSIRGRVKA